MAKVLCLTEKEVTMQIPYSGSASPLLFVKGASPHFTVSSPTDGDNWAFHNFITRIQPPAVVNGTEQLSRGKAKWDIYPRLPQQKRFEFVLLTVKYYDWTWFLLSPFKITNRAIMPDMPEGLIGQSHLGWLHTLQPRVSCVSKFRNSLSRGATRTYTQAHNWTYTKSCALGSLIHYCES